MTVTVTLPMMRHILFDLSVVCSSPKASWSLLHLSVEERGQLRTPHPSTDPQPMDFEDFICFSA